MKNLDSLGLKLVDGRLLILDQTLLPHEERWLECRSIEDMIAFIKELKVRGAPLIGVAAALALALYAKNKMPDEITRVAMALREARPTAVNLMNAIDRMLAVKDGEGSRLLEEATRIFEEDVRLCEEMAEEGAGFISDGDRILTHCNTGGLATVGCGTALGVIAKAHSQGKRIHVYVDETRPLLQGARLTTWELKKLGIPHTLICDNMAGTLMAQKKIDKIFVGADRVARNGDFANKVGTYGVAVLASHHKIPFYMVAPTTTVDSKCPSGASIPIEERNASEVRGREAPKESPVYNPAFDVTPAGLVAGHIGCSGEIRRA